MSGFDTSGYVPEYGNEAMVTLWTDLNPFTQGYVEALFSSRHLERDEDQPVTLAFSDLAPETLARIMEDCERASKDYAPLHRAAGQQFWRDQQCGLFDLVPLTPYLGDDGKVYLRDAPSPSSDRGGS